MVKKGIMLDPKSLKKGIKVYRVNIEVILKFTPLIFVEGIHSFLEHTHFYCRFIKNFCKIAHPFSKFLEKEMKFVFDDAC